MDFLDQTIFDQKWIFSLGPIFDSDQFYFRWLEISVIKIGINTSGVQPSKIKPL